MTSQSVCEGCGRPVDPGTTLCASCAKAPPEHPARDDAPTIARPLPSFSLPGLTFRALIGEGGMGSVHLAEEVALGRRVAVKMIAERYAADEGVKSRFLREARAMATIEHPHVVRIYSYGEAAGTAYLTMEYVDGEDLATRLRRAGRLGVDEAIRLALQIVEGLEAGWEHRIVHRDIKPSNILIDRRGNARVADFGLAKPIETGGDPSLTQSGYLLGTPQYISPEQAQGKNVDFRSDLYSLGVMLHHLLTGKHPFEASTPVAMVARHLTEPLPPLEQQCPDAPPDLARLIEWMTRKDPEQRPSSYAEVRERLAAMVGSTPPRAVPTVKLARGAARAGSRRLELGIASIVVAAVVLGLWMFAARSRVTVSDPPAPAATAADPRFALAVAPFYGPDAESTKEGRVMAALVERAVEAQLGARNVRIFGIDVTEKPLRDHDAARALGARLGADAVIWGEAIAYRSETEIVPYVTILSSPQQQEPAAAGSAASAANDPLAQIEEGPVGAVTLQTDSPNQIEMRKTSAAGVGEVAAFLAGVHALKKQSKPEAALELFRQAPPSRENLRYQVEALIAARRAGEAIPILVQLAAEEPGDAPAHALLGDLYAGEGRLEEALAAYRTAAATGAAWTTMRGFAQDGDLYLKETFVPPLHRGAERPEGSEQETGYLLEVDPSSGRVRARHLLPGIDVKFEPAEDAIAIRYKYLASFAEDVVHFAGGSYAERPALPSLLVRMRARNAGKALAVNFLAAIDRRREPGESGTIPFRVTKIVDPTAPATFPDLERALRAATEQDPTQPWHLFFLGHALAGEGRRGEAEAVWRAMAAREFPAVPYYEFAAMAAVAETEGERALADLTYARARAARAAASPPYLTTVIERLINAPFVRAGISIPDMERRYLLLQRARELSGNEIDIDWLAAAAWAKYFDQRGDRARAAREKALMKERVRDPFSAHSAIAYADYGLAILFAGLGAGLALMVVLIPASFGRARASDPGVGIAALFHRIPRPARLVVTTLVGGVLALDVARFAMGIPPVVLVGPLPVVPLLLWLLWRSNVSVRGMFAAINVRERVAVAAVLAALLVGSSGMIALQHVGAVAALPIGVADAFGSIQVARSLEEKFQKEPDPALAFLVGLSHHYGGRTAQARDYYGKAGPSAKPQLAALDRGEIPPPATPSQLERGFLGRSAKTPGEARRLINQFFDSTSWFAYVAAFFILFAAGALIVPPRPTVQGNGEQAPTGIAWRLVMVVVPGIFDMRRGAPLRGVATLFLALVWIAPVAALWRSPIPVPGVLSSLWLPNFLASIPFPYTPEQGPLEYAWSAVLFAYPLAHLFWGFIAFALAASLALHLSRVPAILRMGRPAVLPRHAAAAN